MSEILYSASPAAVGELLRGGGEFNTPERILDDLTEEQAERVSPGSPYSVAQVMAHLHFWQDRVVARVNGEKRERPAHLDDTFAAPPPGQWEALRAAFLAGIGEVKRLAEANRQTVSPDRDDTTLCYDLAESALHNGYHLGQVVLLRQQLGLWPPRGGDENDY